MTALTTIDLEDNDIVAIEDLRFLPAMDSLNAMDNALVCDGRMAWMKSLPATLTLELDLEPCEAPADLEFTAWNDITRRDLTGRGKSPLVPNRKR